MEGSRPISSLKKALACPEQVRAFQLSGRFESLPDDLRRLRNLEALVLKGNALTTLPDWLSELQQLSRLVITNQGRGILTGGTVERLTELPSLRELEISMVSGVILPDELARLTHLERLSVTFCDLEKLPPDLGALDHLRILDLSNNKLSELPETLRSLRGLREFQIADNRLESVPVSISELALLEILKLSKNRIGSLGDLFSGLSSLRKCYVDSNQLCQLPPSLVTLGKLELLDIANNPFGALPESIGALSRLVQLYAASCRLAGLPDALCNLAELKLLNLNSNNLTRLPAWIGAMKGLEDLHFKSNQIATVPDELFSLTRLRTMMVGGNPIAPPDLARIIKRLPSCAVDYADAGLSAQQRARFEAAIVASLTPPVQPLVSQDSTNLRELLFGDAPLSDWKPQQADAKTTEPWSSFEAARTALEKADSSGAALALRQITQTPGIETRHHLQAWHFLKRLGIQPDTLQAKRVEGVVLEVHLDGGLDTLAAYADGSIRYINYSGSLVVSERADAEMRGLIDTLLRAGQRVADLIGPWNEARRPPPPKHHVRINMLTASGLHFGEGPFDVLSEDPMGGPVIAAGTALISAIVSRAGER